MRHGAYYVFSRNLALMQLKRFGRKITRRNSKTNESIANGLPWAALGACLPLLVFYEVYSLFLAEVSQPATRIMPFFWFLYAGLLFFSVSMVAWCVNKTLALITFSAFFVFCVWSTKLSFTPQFLDLHAYVKWTIGVSAFAIIFLIAKKLSSRGKWAPIGLGAVLLVVFVVAPSLSKDATHVLQDPDFLTTSQRAFEEGYDSAAQKLSLFSAVRLKSKPNFYIMVFDSLVPVEVADLFYGSGSAGYATELSNYFIRPRGFTAQNYIWSKNSMREIMWLGFPDESGGYDYFNGMLDSPLANLFRSNGYDVTTGYTTTYWGETGDYITDYLHLASAPLQLRQTTLCIDNGDSFASRLRAFGICSLIGPFAAFPSLGRLLDTLISIAPQTDHPNASWHRAVDNHIRLSAASATPKLTFLYTYTPIGHTKLDYDHAIDADRMNYVKHFKKYSRLAGIVIQNLVDTIFEVDKDAIVILAGDHGAGISRKSSGAPWFKVIDEQMVALGLMKTANQCVTVHESGGFVPNPLGYHTVSSAVISVLSCLADDDTLPERVPFPPPSRITKELQQLPVGVGWEEFLRSHISKELLMTFPNVDESEVDN